MTFLSALYTLVISPLELLFEIIFTIANKIIGNEGISIIFLSLAVNFLVLPLYKRADELQAEERDIQAKMASRIKQIKHTFKGDERFFMLQEYYRINHYKPIYALKSSVSLLLQVPFFIAAYNLLSGMQSLQGMSFGFISDLGKEDATFMIGSFPVNILPILMTLINVVSGIIYTKGHPVKEKIQVYGLAAVFLVLLYNSPSGLVFYWLLNNVFSLVKNIFYKLKDPRKALSIVLAVCGAVILVLTLIRNDLDARQKVLLAMGCVMLAMPLVSNIIRSKTTVKEKPVKKDKKVFLFGAVFMATLTGLLIPSSVIHASIYEFIDEFHPINPCMYTVNAMLLSFGSFVLWGSVFYFFMSDKMKGVFCKGIWIICGVSTVDYILFGTKLGILSSTLQYENKPAFGISDYLINIAAVILVAVVFAVVYAKLPKVLNIVLAAGVLAVGGMGLLNSYKDWDTYSAYHFISSSSADDIPVIPLSKNGQNVVVLMLDRAVGTEVPYIFNENPELAEQFDGFTYYKNSISYGAFTNTGSPALFGGYEYTPERLNARDDMSLESKHNEALKVMPVIFSEAGYTVTLCDPTYAGYQWTPDLSVFDDHPEFHCYNTDGRFNYSDAIEGVDTASISARLKDIRDRNFFCYSLMKISPVLLQETIYDGGLYNEAISGNASSNDLEDQLSLTQTMDGISKSTGYDAPFLQAYSVLTNLPKITEISDGSENTFLMMSNDTAHEPCLLQEPEYIPALNIDNTAFDANNVSRFTIDGRTMRVSTEDQMTAYHANMATYIQLGKWFDYLRENGVYDNTRIILVSDHGRDLDHFDIKCGDMDMEYFMPVVMVKDFNATGFTVSEEFMTNADTPTLATSGIIDNPVNPFTKNPINSELKYGPQTIFFSSIIETDINNGNQFLPGSWYTFQGCPYDPDAWEYNGDH